MTTKLYWIIIGVLLALLVITIGYHTTVVYRLEQEVTKTRIDRDHFKAALVDAEYYRQADADLLHNYQEALSLFRYADSAQANRFEIIMEGLDIKNTEDDQ